MTACLVLVTTVFVQFDYGEFAKSFLRSALMFANHHFLSYQGYFETAAFTKPLLHMWSLSVEEQFYLIAPLTLVSLFAFTKDIALPAGRHIRIVITAAIAAVSFVACVALSYGEHNVAFFIMPTRGWEFILGGIAPALIPTLRRRPELMSDAIAIAGIVAIVLAVVIFDGDAKYPSFRAVLPALGAMLIIASGLAKPRNAVARVLSTRPMVAVGLVSYAWYLWHWPLLSLLRTTNFNNHDIRQALAVAALSLALAVLTYRFVELPIRNWRRSRRPRSAPIMMSMVMACLLVGGLGYVWASYEAPRLLPAVTGLQPIAVTDEQYPPVTHRGVLLGDSHAIALGARFQEFARRVGSSLTLTVHNGCPPLLHTDIIVPPDERVKDCAALYEGIDFSGSEFVILAARWNFYLGLPWSDPYYRTYELADERIGVAAAAPAELLRRGLTAIVAKAKREGVHRILILGPLPEFPAHAPDCLVRMIWTGIDGCSMDRAPVDVRRRLAMEVLRRTAGEVEGVRLIDPIDVFCTATTCRPYSGRILYFSDSNHLSPAGIELLYRTFDAEIQWVMAGKQPQSVRCDNPAR